MASDLVYLSIQKAGIVRADIFDEKGDHRVLEGGLHFNEQRRRWLTDRAALLQKKRLTRSQIDELGSQLFDTLFDKSLLKEFFPLFRQANKQLPLYIQLYIEPSLYQGQLIGLPWELLRVPPNRGERQAWLSTAASTRFFRSYNLQPVTQPVQSKPQLQIGVVLYSQDQVTFDQYITRPVSNFTQIKFVALPRDFDLRNWNTLRAYNLDGIHLVVDCDQPDRKVFDQLSRLTGRQDSVDASACCPAYLLFGERQVPLSPLISITFTNWMTKAGLRAFGDHFYRHLSMGKPVDEAVQLARRGIQLDEKLNPSEFASVILEAGLLNTEHEDVIDHSTIVDVSLPVRPVPVKPGPDSEVARDPSPPGAPLPGTKVDFVLVTALPEERDAVLESLPGSVHLPPVQEDIRSYFQVDLPVTFSDTSTGSYRIVVMCLLNQGRVQAGIATVDAIRYWHPRYVLLLGIAEGVADRGVQRGDILISDQVVDYELQHLTKQGPKIRWDVQRADARLLNACKNFRGEGWQKLMRVERPTAGAPVLHFGPIASGDKVITSREVLGQYRGMWGELLGVETEAAGVSTAAFQATDRPGFFMIRGVSEMADREQGANAEKWRSYAIDVAASYTVAFLKSGPVPVSGTL